ncbi:MAG: hypothetical protein ACE144_16155 [Thermodesulfobacteriota bacterium]
MRSGRSRAASEASRSKLRGIRGKAEQNSAEACHPPSSGLRRGHLALHPDSKPSGLRAEARELINDRFGEPSEPARAAQRGIYADGSDQKSRQYR